MAAFFLPNNLKHQRFLLGWKLFLIALTRLRM